MTATYSDRISGVETATAIKAPVKVATTANITLSGTQTIDGVAVVAGDRVLVKDQTDTTENGIYNAAIGAWARSLDFNGARDIVMGTQIYVNLGDTYAGLAFSVNTASPVVGSALAFKAIASLGLEVGVNVQAYNANLASLSGLTFAANKGLYTTGANTAALFDLTAAGRALLDDADASAQRTTLGLGTAATVDVIDEDDMATDSATRPPSQQSVRAFVAARAGETPDTAQATTSGTTKDFTGIPDWATRITIHFNGVSLSGTDQFLVQIGDSGGLETSGYNSGSLGGGNYTSSTSGYVAFCGNAASVYYGQMTLTKADGNKWSEGHTMTTTPNSRLSAGGGFKELSATLDRVRITTTGTDTFDAGEINVSYS